MTPGPGPNAHQDICNPGAAAPGSAHHPLVSVVLPVRNEAGHIAEALDALLAGDYPRDRMEVLVVDGRSADDTCAIVRAAAARDDRVRLLDNPGATTPRGLNVGLAAGFGGAVPLTPRLSVTFEADSWGTRSQTSFRKLYNGHLRVRPFLFGLRYEFRGNGYFTPYAVAGAGYVETKFRIGSLPVIPDVTIDQSVRSGWAGYFGGGIVWRLSGFWDFFAEIDYLIRTAPGRTVVRDANTGLAIDDIMINLHVVYLKVGLRFLL